MNEPSTITATEQAKAARTAYQREYARRYREIHRDKLNAYQREYNRRHPERKRAYNISYWERKAAALMEQNAPQAE